VDGVVVGEREDLDARRGGGLDHAARRQLSIGVLRVALEVEDGRLGVQGIAAYSVMPADRHRTAIRTKPIEIADYVGCSAPRLPGERRKGRRQMSTHDHAEHDHTGPGYASPTVAREQ